MRYWKDSSWRERERERDGELVGEGERWGASGRGREGEEGGRRERCAIGRIVRGAKFNGETTSMMPLDANEYPNN